ncbi:MAG: hypothetical protein A3I68_04010 [Candidatus Melainabacteria bacterium RIFCSPLOWO2_02_FULL_35_15]|nr:MAG: hypothetical protein A3F80_01520 [Candidatus Melainabacteria bacterium RIFCSPLOWO2_12_FULL_35_11]OGI13136.1 MAG: hypothetical protein A3I68_04010 [Candidatus Melainabacteria bacterium RIFCSPLOWO2_02_FULL_35_15]
MKRKYYIFIGLFVLLILLITPLKSYSQSATIPVNITVNGTLTISDASNDSSAGKNPTINVNLSITPDLGTAPVTGDANFRIRTNRSTWRLTAQRTTEIDTGPTNIVAMDITLSVTTQAGTNANAMAGTLVAPFNAGTDLSSISTSAPVDVISGTAKTSTARDNTNTNNYFQVNTLYSILPDFFFQPGTWRTTITYNLVSP